MKDALRGMAASPGAGIGPAWVLDTGIPEPPEGGSEDREGDAQRVEAALESVAEFLEMRAAESRDETAEVLSATAAMARDPELLDGAQAAVRDEGAHPAAAVLRVGERYAAVLAASDNEYLAARAADVRDVGARTARRLLGEPDPDLTSLSQASVVVASDLAPADVATIDPALVRALVMVQGSRTSHAAIIARSMSIPAVVGVRGLLSEISSGMLVAVDGDSGEVLVEPDAATAAEFEKRAEQRTHRRASLQHLVDKPAATADGHRVELAVNLASSHEIETALREGARGVGLLRTELFYLDRNEPPTEDEQAELFGLVAERMPERVVVRTFDIGADKPVPFIEAEVGPNPALGVRGLRLARAHPELLMTQLRAVARAADRGRLAVMAPMVATLDEARWFRDRCEEAGCSDNSVEVGIMVEIPSAVLMADALAEVVDFMSIGTNDLGSYLHAADRQEGTLAHLQDPFSPALLRAVETVCKGANDGAWVGVCGEAAGDPLWACLAVGLGVSELSMGSGSLLETKAALGAVSLSDCKSAAGRALATIDARSARKAVETLLPDEP